MVDPSDFTLVVEVLENSWQHGVVHGSGPRQVVVENVGNYHLHAALRVVTQKMCTRKRCVDASRGRLPQYTIEQRRAPLNNVDQRWVIYRPKKAR